MSLPLRLVPMDELDPRNVLTRTEAARETRRAAELEDLQLGLAWADLHAADPRLAPGVAAKRDWVGRDRLVDIGGEGTPAVQELCLPELAVARGVHTLSARAMLAGALDLRHRLPMTWAALQDADAAVWVARKVAALSRRLELATVGVVDTAVADALAGEAPSRVLALTEAKVIEADLVAHQARLEARRRQRMVAVGATDEHGSRTLFARMEPGEVAWLETRWSTRSPTCSRPAASSTPTCPRGSARTSCARWRWVGWHTLRTSLHCSRSPPTRFSAGHRSSSTSTCTTAPSTARRPVSPGSSSSPTSAP